MSIKSIALLLAAVPAAFAVPVVSVQTGPLGPGQTFTAGVSITGVTDLYAFQFNLSFSPQIVAATSVTEGAFLPSGGATFFAPGAINNTAGTITLTADSLLASISGVSGTGTLASIVFHGVGQGVSPIAISNVQLLDSTLSPIAFATADGASPSITPEPRSLLLALCGSIAMLLAASTGRTLSSR